MKTLHTNHVLSAKAAIKMAARLGHADMKIPWTVACLTHRLAERVGKLSHELVPWHLGPERNATMPRGSLYGARLYTLLPIPINLCPRPSL